MQEVCPQCWENPGKGGRGMLGYLGWVLMGE